MLKMRIDINKIKFNNIAVTENNNKVNFQVCVFVVAKKEPRIFIKPQ